MHATSSRCTGNRGARRLAVWLAASLLMPAGLAMAAGHCFTIYAADGEVIYRSVNTPVDLSRPISETMAARYPGAHLVWTSLEDRSCQELDRGRQRRESGRGSASGFIEVPQLRLLSEFKASGGRTDAGDATGVDAGAAWTGAAQHRAARAAMR